MNYALRTLKTFTLRGQPPWKQRSLRIFLVSRPRQAVYGAAALLMVMKAEFFKWIQFWKILTLICPKNPFLLRETSKNWIAITKVSNVPRKIISAFQKFNFYGVKLQIQTDFGWILLSTLKFIKSLNKTRLRRKYW